MGLLGGPVQTLVMAAKFALGLLQDFFTAQPEDGGVADVVQRRFAREFQ